MAIGKVNKKGGIKLKASQKKYTDPFTRKKWFAVLAPSFAKNRRIFTKICANKDTPSKSAADSLRNRIISVNTKLLVNNQQQNSSTNKSLSSSSMNKIFGLKVIDVIGNVCVTIFNSARNVSTKQFARRRTTLISAITQQIRTFDQFQLSVEIRGVTGKQLNQLKANCYASNHQIKQLRKLMIEIVRKEFEKRNLNEIAELLISESIETQIRLASMSIYSLAEVSVAKVKILASPPQFDSMALLSHHGGVEGFKSSISSQFDVSQYGKSSNSSNNNSNILQESNALKNVMNEDKGEILVE